MGRCRNGLKGRAAVLFDLQGGQCYYCAREMSTVRPPRSRCAATFDHRIPISRGGSNRIYNGCLACKECNARKADRTEAEFIASWPPSLQERRAAHIAQMRGALESSTCWKQVRSKLHSAEVLAWKLATCSQW